MRSEGWAVLGRRGPYLEVVHAWIDAIEQLCKEAVRRRRCAFRLLSAVHLRSVICCHPLKKPRVGIIVTSDLEIDKHSSPYERGTMLESFLSCSCSDA